MHPAPAESPAHGGPPPLPRNGPQIQPFGTLRPLPLGLGDDVRSHSCDGLNRLLADTQVLHSLYKKHHWLVHGPTFPSLHLMLDRHAGEQLALVDALAERIQTLGGVAVGDPRHVAELTCVPRPPDGVEPVPAMLARLLDAHERILPAARDAAARAASAGDEGTADLLVSGVVRTGEAQVWFLAATLADTSAPRD
ncbi:DNA starvation/stationary phase protection protein [Streptomyces bambusae]|uniref:Dps family protein n=1 Tax=Streptomyces bambusae TaxID=1550616 RepID=UPI001CFF1D18|nr:DNA starvation/stationary phase protection protein [Streptomyces bambusae]MCB5168814.1 DNA starvation/stationary phase protection protein [Streptomyces bambusae]